MSSVAAAISFYDNIYDEEMLKPESEQLDSRFKANLDAIDWLLEWELGRHVGESEAAAILQAQTIFFLFYIRCRFVFLFLIC